MSIKSFLVAIVGLIVLAGCAETIPTTSLLNTYEGVSKTQEASAISKDLVKDQKNNLVQQATTDLISHGL